jgi:hypothetical protein
MIKSFLDFRKNISESKLNHNPRLKRMKYFSQYIAESFDEEMRSQVAAMANDKALEKADKIIEMSLLKIFTHYPMFRPFIDLMPPIAKFGAGSRGPDGVGTMSTSGSAIFYDPRFVIRAYEQGKIDFASELDPKTAKRHFRVLKAGRRHQSDYVTFVLIHEILHNSLKHFLRKPVASDYLTPYEVHKLWNIATDYEINHILKPDQMLKLFPGGVDAEAGDFEVAEDEKEFFTTNAAEKIFWRLLKNLEEKRRQEQEDAEEGGEGGDTGEQEGGDTGEQEGGDTGEQEGGDQGEQEGGDQGEQEGGDQGEQEGGDGEGDGNGDGGEGDGSPDRPLRVGDTIIDHETGTYGKITNISGDDVEYEELSQEEIRKLTQQ